MKSFITFLLEYDVPGQQIDREPIRGTGTLFPASLGYTQRGVEGFNPRASSLFHMTRYFPDQLRIRPGIEADTSGVNPRATLHFTRNGVVSDHMFGGWADTSKFGIMMPEYRVSDRLVNSGHHDSWMVGGVELPTGSRVLVQTDKLDDADKKRFMDMFGVKSWEEAAEQMKPWDPDKGVYGRDVDFNGRKITFSGLQPDELALDSHRAAVAQARREYNDRTGKWPNPDEKTGNPLLDAGEPPRGSGLEKAAHRHMRSVGIDPVSIGMWNAMGFVDPSAEKTQRDRGFGEPDRSDFSRIYTGGDRRNSGLIHTYYRNLNPVSRVNMDSNPDWKPFEEMSVEDHTKNILERLKGTSSDSHSNTVWIDLDRMASRSDKPSSEHYLRAQQGARDALRAVLANPTEYHPTAFSHPEAQAALKLQMDRLTSVIQPPKPKLPSPPAPDAPPIPSKLNASKSLKGKAAKLVPLVLAGWGATEATAKGMADNSDFASPEDALSPSEMEQIDSENEDKTKNKSSQQNTTIQGNESPGLANSKNTMNDLLRKAVFEQHNKKNVPDSEDIEMEEMERLEKANTEDLKEYPGEKGKRAHTMLHKTVQNVLNKMKSMHEAKDGDYEGAPEDKPMTDQELDAYHKEYTSRKKKLKK